jgi:peptidoglycan/xylan/chitin deacetylase (PgdA/CDA1 family)
MASALQATAACATAMGLVAGGLLYASRWPGSQIFGRTLIAGINPSEIALTFDDGPNEAVTPRLLEVLARHQVRATFFAIGAYVRQSPDLAREVLAAGHVLGNHTMHHPRLSTEPAARVRQELADCNAALEDITGTAIRFFRPPFGARRPFVLRAARELGLTPVMWNVSASDWNPIGEERILAHLRAGIERNQGRRRGSNVLLHDGGDLEMAAARMDTVRAVDRLITESSGTATRFVTVDAWAGRL